MNILFKLLLKQQPLSSTNGFTLIELIIASVMSVFVLSVAGFGLLFALREQAVTSASGDLQYNLNRAVDFIAEEVKQASAVTTTATLPSGCVGTGTNTVVLGLTIPPDTTTNVIYYTKTPPNSTWLGPSSIYRCGPSFSAAGVADYSSSSTKSAEILIDLIASDSNTNTCQNGGTANPTTNSGFFVCITNTKLVEIQANANAMASLDTIAGTNASSRYGNKLTYSAITQVYARSAP
ncbi:type II secretion system protein [Synechocystis sp. LKSZ1]|uniref:PilW family protein n=1 Tax=Synechocystis sp. LKSZ1 TaxID=3144951 RepID=UPI00336BF39E